MSDLIKWQNQLHCTLGTRGFFFSRVRLDASLSATGRQIFGRRPADLGSRGSQFKDLSETGHRA